MASSENNNNNNFTSPYSSTSKTYKEDEQDRIFQQLLHPEKELNKIGVSLALVPTLYGILFCWERGIQAFLVLTFGEISSQILLNVVIQRFATNLTQFSVINLFRIPIIMSVQFFMYFFYGPLVPYHVFSIFRILIASNNCYYDIRLLLVHGLGNVISTVGGMYYSYLKERHTLSPCEEAIFPHKLMEVIVLQYLVWVGSILFSYYVKKRNDEYTENQIEIAKEKHLNTEKTKFIANLSHEARNSLQGIMATVEVLKHKFHDGICMKSCEHCFKKDSAISELIGDIQSSASILLHILSSSLQMSSLEMGTIKLKNEEFNILSLFESMTGVFSLEAQGKNLSLNSFFDASKVPLNLKGDSVRVSQILMNIISNAIKYTSQGFVRVNCTCANEKELGEFYNEIEEEKSYVKFECIDTGCGIAHDQLGKLFQPYSTIDSNTDVTHRFDFYFKTVSNNASVNNGGSSLINTNRNGLGLSITKLLVEKMNGRIVVDSVKGKGTTVSVVIPFKMIPGHEHSVDRGERLNSKNLSQMLKEPAQSGNKIAVFIIDENKSFRDCLKSYLEIFKRVHAIEEFEFAEEFIEKFKSENRRCLIFCNEKEFEKISKAFNPEGDVKIILTVLRGSSRLYADMHYLSKPILLRDLVEIFDDNGVIKQNMIIGDKPRSSLGEFANKSVLVADDNAVNRKILVNILKIIGFKDIDTANDGLDCFNKFKQKDYSLILLDCFMPVMTGRESCEMIRNFEKQKDRGEKRIPIFAITANTWETKEQLLFQGFDDVLYKPISLNDLKKQIQDVIL